MSDTAQDYQQLLSHALQKQMVILGKQIALVKARHVAELTVSDDGHVTGIDGDPKKAVTQFLQEFRELSSPLVKKTMKPLLDSITETPAPMDPEIPDPLAIKPLPGIIRHAPETHEAAPPSEAKPNETQPDTKPEEIKPATETKPDEVKPTEQPAAVEAKPQQKEEHQTV